MGRGRDSSEYLVGGCCCCSVLIASVIMLACSFGIVEPHEWGLLYNGVQVRIEKDTIENGRNFVGLGNWYVKYPRKLQYVEFSDSGDGGIRNHPIDVWSRDGQEIYVEAGFYFELDETKIINLYYEFEQNYLPVIEDVAANAIRDVSTRFTTIQFFTNRSSIDEEMHLELQTRLAECCFTRVPIFNLLGIDVPERFRDAVEDVVIMQQERTTKEVLRDALVLRQSIRVVDATAENTITVAKARANAQGSVIRARAEAQARVSIETARSQAIANLSEALGFAPGGNLNARQLLTYTFAELVRTRSDIVVNIPNVLIQA